MKPLRLTCFYFAASALIAGATGLPCAAQTPAPPAKKYAVEIIRYNPQEDGALFCVSPLALDAETRERLARLTLTQYAVETGRRVSRERGISALVPQTMLIVATVLPKADPLAGMGAGERLQILLGTLTPAQWRTAGGDSGIGVGDLTDEQRPLFAGLFPADDIVVSTLRRNPEPNSSGNPVWMGDGVGKTYSVRGARLRLRRRVTVALVNAKKQERDLWYIGDRDSEETNEETREMTNVTRLVGDAAPSHGADGAERNRFGQSLVLEQPNRAKPSDLNRDAAALRVAVRLDGSHKTVGELLALLAKQTRLDLVADVRLAKLPLVWRVAPAGHSVPASDVLTLLCRSVTGTVRRLDPPDGTPPVYLLTDDREGLGTRLSRLGVWGMQGDMAKQTVLSKAIQSAAKSDPLSAVRFAPDDPLALPPALSDAVDAGYRANGQGALTQSAAVSPALRDAIVAAQKLAAQKRYGGDDEPKWSTENLRVGASLGCDYVLSSGKIIEAPFGRNFFRYDLKIFAAPPRSRPVPPAPKPGDAVLPQTPLRRVCVVSLPDAGDDTKALLSLIRAKGFTETWFRVSLHDAQTPARLADAIAIGNALQMPVGASVPWLKRIGAETWGADDINLAGNTGKQFAETDLLRFREMVTVPSPDLPPLDEIDHIFRLLDDYMTGWTTPDATPAHEPLTRLLAVLGLSTLALTDTAAPGWESETGSGGAFIPGSAFGYPLATRVACVRAEGFDPVDVVGGSERPPVTVPLLDNGGDSLHRALFGFRFRQNRRELSRLTGGVLPKSAPLYVEESNAPFSGNGAYERHVPGDAKTAGESMSVYAPFMEFQPDRVAGAVARSARRKAGLSPTLVVSVAELLCPICGR